MELLRNQFQPIPSHAEVLQVEKNEQPEAQKRKIMSHPTVYNRIKSDIKQQFITRIVQVVENNFENAGFNVSNIASELAMSRRSFYR